MEEKETGSCGLKNWTPQQFYKASEGPDSGSYDDSFVFPVVTL